MKLRFVTILISLLATSGCEQKPNVEGSANDGTGDESGSAVVVEEQAPVFQAEFFLESRSPDKGVVRFSGGYVSSYRKETRDGGEGAPQTNSEGWGSKKIEMEFNLQDGSVCKIKPTFIEHREGYDVWRIESNYVASGESNATPRALVSKEILFDGKSPVVVTEDEGHSIIVRPRTETDPEQGGDAKRD